MSEIFNNRNQYFQDTLNENTLKKDKPFTRKKIYLDKAFNFDDTGTENNFTQSFRGFWIVGSGSNDFKVSMKVNIANTLGDSLPLKHNFSLDFNELMDGARFEFEAQSGNWIEILFFHKGFAQIGNQELDNLKIDMGKISLTEIVPVSESGVSICEIDDSNRKVSLVNISLIPLFIGNKIDVESSDYQNLCEFLPPNQSMEIEGSKQIYARSFYGDGNIKKIVER